MSPQATSEAWGIIGILACALGTYLFCILVTKPLVTKPRNR